MHPQRQRDFTVVMHLSFPRNSRNERNEADHTSDISQVVKKILTDTGSKGMFQCHQITGTEQEKRGTHEQAEACWLARKGSEVSEKDHKADETTRAIQQRSHLDGGNSWQDR